MLTKSLVVLFTLAGCNKSYDLEACNELSMKQFKGFTDAKEKFLKNCQQFEIKYTQELCQSALTDLILSNDLPEVKSKYGDPIEQCFTPQDLKKYNKR